ncbi:hypothetical protein OIV83_001829 [Microbotryomycetes sp. JL201]|nr:hypothetical protein OIV83_001829 [Microbotryomycetes sp. JL201]
MSQVVIEDLTEADLRQLAEGNWNAFPTFYAPIEQDPLPEHELRLRRCIQRLKILLNSPTTFNRKAVVDGKLVGIALWNRPGAPIFNLKRRIVADLEGVPRPANDDDENWAGLTDDWEKVWSTWDNKRKELMAGADHWYLAPIWVLPQYQGRGIGSKLLQEVIDLADATTPSTPIYLEASKEGAPLYAKRGFEAVGDSEYVEMIRWGRRT